MRPTNGITVHSTWNCLIFCAKRKSRAPQCCTRWTGFTGHSRVKTSTLIDAGGKLPIVLTFIDSEENVLKLLPTIKEMAGHRLIVREKVTIEGVAD